MIVLNNIVQYLANVITTAGTGVQEIIKKVLLMG